MHKEMISSLCGPIPTTTYFAGKHTVRAVQQSSHQNCCVISSRRSLCKQSSRQKLQCAAGRSSESVAQTQQDVGVSSQPPPQRPSLTQNWPVRGAAALLLLLAALRLVKQLGRGSSVSDLEARGYLDESRGNEDPYLKDVMKNIRTIKIEELTEEEIMAARKRRSRARGVSDLDAANIDIPDNHPFATQQEVTPEEEELAKKRLEVTRGLPLQDLSGRRGFPDDGYQAADSLSGAS